MNYRPFLGVSVLLAGLFVSCGEKQPGQPTVPGVSFKPALLVIDIQNEYLPVMDQKDLALSHYERAYRRAKEKNDPYVQIFEKNYRRLKESKE